MRLSKKHCCLRLVSVIACLSFTFSSLPASHVKAQESPRFCLVLDPFTHCVEKVQIKDIFSVIDLHFLADQSPLTFSDLVSSPETEQNCDLFPWDASAHFHTSAIPGKEAGVSVPTLSHQTWFDRLMQIAFKYKE
ncbi:MAG: hypothetical protein Q4B90_01450 [Eubacteriales bacterium]|nr:hypothetical protein [Eubacteriales bacterium]